VRTRYENNFFLGCSGMIGRKSYRKKKPRALRSSMEVRRFPFASAGVTPVYRDFLNSQNNSRIQLFRISVDRWSPHFGSTARDRMILGATPSPNLIHSDQSIERIFAQDAHCYYFRRLAEGTGGSIEGVDDTTSEDLRSSRHPKSQHAVRPTLTTL
jgi:hypothetical protein